MLPWRWISWDTPWKNTPPSHCNLRIAAIFYAKLKSRPYGTIKPVQWQGTPSISAGPKLRQSTPPVCYKKVPQMMKGYYSAYLIYDLCNQGKSLIPILHLTVSSISYSDSITWFLYNDLHGREKSAILKRASCELQGAQLHSADHPKESSWGPYSFGLCVGRATFMSLLLVYFKGQGLWR